MISPHIHEEIVLSNFFKRTNEEGNSIIAVSLTSSSSRPLIFPKFSGSSLSFEHPDKVRIFKDIKQQQTFGRLERFLQPLRSNLIRPVKCSIDNGRSFIAVSFN